MQRLPGGARKSSGFARQDQANAKAAVVAVCRFDPSAVVRMPMASEQRAFHRAYPDGLVLQFPKLSSQIQRDFKWLDSYRYGIVHLGGEDPTDLRRRCEHASSLLGWAAPYVDSATDLPGLGEVSDEWPTALGTENSTG